MKTKDLQQMILSELNNVMKSCMKEEDQLIIASLKVFNRESLEKEEYMSSILKYDYELFQSHLDDCLHKVKQNKILVNMKESKDVASIEMLSRVGEKFMDKYFGPDAFQKHKYQFETIKSLQFIEEHKNDLLNAISSSPENLRGSQDNPYKDFIQDYVISTLSLVGTQEGDISLDDLDL